MYFRLLKKLFKICQVIVRIWVMSLQLYRIVKMSQCIVLHFFYAAQKWQFKFLALLCAAWGKVHLFYGTQVYWPTFKFLQLQDDCVVNVITDILNGARHSVDRVPGFLSSRSNWVRPLLHPQASVAPPPLWFQRGITLACGERVHVRIQFGRGDRHCACARRPKHY